MKSKFDAYCARALKTAPGQPAPDFSFPDMDGNMVSLEDLRGKYVYIDIWATYCSPCRAEIPYLQKLEEKLKDKNIDLAILKANSPTCGSKTIYDGTFSHTLVEGNGLFAKLLKDNKIMVISEKDIE